MQSLPPRPSTIIFQLVYRTTRSHHHHHQLLLLHAWLNIFLRALAPSSYFVNTTDLSKTTFDKFSLPIDTEGTTTFLLLFYCIICKGIWAVNIFLVGNDSHFLNSSKIKNWSIIIISCCWPQLHGSRSQLKGNKHYYYYYENQSLTLSL